MPVWLQDDQVDVGQIHGEVQHADLTELALAAEPQRRDEENEHQQRSQDLLRQRDLRDEEISYERRSDQASRALRAVGMARPRPGG